MVAEVLASAGIRSPDRPSRSESLYRLRYPDPHFTYKTSCMFRLMTVAVMGMIAKIQKRKCLQLRWWLQISKLTNVVSCKLLVQYTKCPALGIIIYKVYKNLHLYHLLNITNFKYMLNI